MWFPIFSVGFFHHNRDGTVARSGFQAQTLEGGGHCHGSVGDIKCHDFLQSYYQAMLQTRFLQAGSSCLPSTVWPTTIIYDGGIVADLYQDNHPNVPEPFPPAGTRILVCLQSASTPSEGTATNIPLKSEARITKSESYIVLLADGSKTPVHC